MLVQRKQQLICGGKFRFAKGLYMLFCTYVTQCHLLVFLVSIQSFSFRLPLKTWQNSLEDFVGL